MYKSAFQSNSYTNSNSARRSYCELWLYYVCCPICFDHPRPRLRCLSKYVIDAYTYDLVSFIRFVVKTSALVNRRVHVPGNHWYPLCRAINTPKWKLDFEYLERSSYTLCSAMCRTRLVEHLPTSTVVHVAPSTMFRSYKGVWAQSRFHSIAISWSCVLCVLLRTRLPHHNVEFSRTHCTLSGLKVSIKLHFFSTFVYCDI